VAHGGDGALGRPALSTVLARVIPILCVPRARRVESRCGDVVVVSLDRLLPALERLAVSTRHLDLSPDGRQSGKRQVGDGGGILIPARSVMPGGHDG
jgi:hypothetical protein